MPRTTTICAARTVAPSAIAMATRPALHHYPRKAQDEARALHEAMLLMDDAGSPNRVATKLAAGAAPGSGWSRSNLMGRYSQWVLEGRDQDPLCCINKKKYPELWNAQQPAGTKLPPEFVIWAAGQLLGNQRKSLPAYRAILLRWRRWKAGDASQKIPGYGTCPPVSVNGKHPDGWSIRNLRDVMKLSKAEIAMARIGSAAAAKHLPKVPGTREDVRWLEFIYFDDVHLDRDIVVAGYMRPVRVLQLGCLDYATGIYLKFGQRPDLPRDDGTRQRLQRTDFLLLVAMLLEEYGYPTGYVMHLIVERGTATLSQDQAKWLYDFSHGQIVTCWTGMKGQLVLAWEERKSGNPDAKGPMESFHNLWHNESAALRGQVGMDRQHSPAALHGQEQEAVALFKAGALMTPEHRQRLQGPFANTMECHRESQEIADRINNRTDHALEGFADILMWKVRGVRMEWLSSAYPPGMESSLDFTPRKESPVERRERLQAEAQALGWARFEPGALTRFYEGDNISTKLMLGQLMITVDKRKLCFGPDRADEWQALADQWQLREGTEVLVHIAGPDPRYAHISLAGRYIATWPLRIAGRKADAEARALEIQRHQSFLRHTTAGVRGKQAEFLEQEERRMAANEDVFRQAGYVRETETTTGQLHSPAPARPASKTDAGRINDAVQAEAARAAKPRDVGTTLERRLRQKKAAGLIHED